MTEKRFTVKGLSIQENSNKRIKYYLSQQGSVDSLCMRINQLFDENKKLERENKDLEEARSYYQENFLTMKTERNQLKEENKQLQNEIARLELINNKLKNADYENYTKKIQKLQDEHLAWKRVDVE